MASSAANVAPIESNGSKRRMCDGGRQKSYRFKKQKTSKPTKDGSNEEVLIEDVRALLQKQSSEDAPAEDNMNGDAEAPSTGTGPLPEPFSEIDLTVSELSSTGDGLALAPDKSRIYVVPFTAPGDTVTAKVIKHFHDHPYTLTDFVKVQQASPHRDDSLIQCPYFARCSGCQFQMLPYSYQLAHKKTIVEKAYRNFSNLSPELVPSVGDTIGSPLQYGYRTKLTPHFDGPPGKRSDKRNGIHHPFKEVPPIGFMQKGTRKTIDIEDCPISTDAVRMGMKRERKRVAAEISTYKRGATLLLRESTKRIPKSPQDEATESAADESAAPKEDVILEDRGGYVYEKTCITDSNATTTEYIDSFIFQNPADAYSGSGLFTITLSSLFTRSLGIDISAPSIASATTNAALNALPASHTTFLAADAANLFASIDFSGSETVVVIDPPRKGCDESFLRQLIRFSPARVVYVSCNVHTQARDVGVLVGGMEGVNGGMGPGTGVYEIESLRGFDFFRRRGM
ncbi:tRNA(m5U54)methyltransferase [Coniosporium tulheliwenetii]|uniref:tRNA(M5U54)methyltransferase n=1 Tax=Coniosporium tulheliwenetii TaxID=3383036 RepID=A0ACC2ZKE9_9PEZI|nr:tRNA(m5U54)methyltransferase [Cladosporium sp. JES 115]